MCSGSQFLGPGSPKNMCITAEGRCQRAVVAKLGQGFKLICRLRNFFMSEFRLVEQLKLAHT